MGKEIEIYEKITSLRQPIKCNKFIGAMTIEVFREFLKKESFNVSERDVFIEGLANEIDLLILKDDIRPIFNAYYRPRDVSAALEIKFRGLYGEDDIRKIKERFEHIREINPAIKCVYLTVYENQKYKHKATNENIGGMVFELFKPYISMDSAIERGIFEDSASGDWRRLVEFLRF